jgi:alcohol dehydrogenase
VVCGTLVAEATRVNIKALLSREPDHSALKKYANLGDVLCGKLGSSQEESRENLCVLLGKWTERLNLQTLSSYGLSEKGIDHVVANCRGGSMKTNPIVLSDSEIQGLLVARL